MKSENLILKIYQRSGLKSNQNGTDYNLINRRMPDNTEREFKYMGSEQYSNNESYFSQIFDTTSDAIIILDENREVIEINRAFEKMFLFSAGEAAGRYIDDLITPSELRSESKKFMHDLNLGLRAKLETSRIDKNGKRIDVLMAGNKIILDGKTESGLYLIYSDISHYKKIEKEIKSSLIDKEVLIREIHHRVKNNLQLISSLLHLQSRNKREKPVDEIFLHCQNRVKAISLVHENLYMTEKITRIDFSKYAKSLTSNLLKSFGISSRIKVIVKSENMFLPMDSAVSCGLIINELVTNSIKHAFSVSKTGEIEIDLRYNNDNFYILSVKDNGTGLPENINVETHRSLGFSLIHSLIRQLDAKLETIKNKGTEFKITFSILNNRGGNN